MEKARGRNGGIPAGISVDSPLVRVALAKLDSGALVVIQMRQLSRSFVALGSAQPWPVPLHIFIVHLPLPYWESTPAGNVLV